MQFFNMRFYFLVILFFFQAALFFQTFYLPWCLSANTLLSFFWLEISFHNSHVTATIHRLFIPCVVNCVLLFMLEISRDVILAVNANPYISYYLSVVGYAILQLLVLFVAVARMLFRMMNSGSKLASLAPRLAFFMCTDMYVWSDFVFFLFSIGFKVLLV